MADSNLSLVARKSLEYMRDEFPRTSREHCPNKKNDTCEITGETCEFESCPKVREKIKNRRG